MISIALTVSFVMLGIALLLNCVALWRGPDLPDRVVALDTLYINAVALLIVFGIHRATQLYFEAALLIALLGFVGTVAFCRYMLRGDLIE